MAVRRERHDQSFILEKSAALWRRGSVGAEGREGRSEDGAIIQARGGWKEASGGPGSVSPCAFPYLGARSMAGPQ